MSEQGRVQLAGRMRGEVRCGVGLIFGLVNELAAVYSEGELGWGGGEGILSRLSE